MTTLTPQWILFDEFWISLKQRNFWFIRLRYGAVILLTGLTAAAQFQRHLYVNPVPLIAIAVGIFCYNLVFHYFWQRIPPRRTRFHGIHFALLQICTDFLALMLVIYFTGGIETPLYLLFIFHVILGSLLLPGPVITLIITCVLLVGTAEAILELNGVIPHQAIAGLYAAPMYDNTDYLILHFAVVGLALYVSAYLANSISKELYKREKSLTLAYDKLEEAEKTKTRYIMSVVHDLKTPVAAVQTYLDLILDNALGEVNDEVRRRLVRARVRTNDSLAMINDVLQISQLKLANSLNITEVDLVELAHTTFREMSELFEERGVEFSIETEQGNPEVIQGDRASLRLMLANVFSNAAKYSPRPGRVVVRFDEHQRGFISIAVLDNGIGIPAEELPKVFQDFYRASNSKKLGIEGTGLGTSIISHVISQHHGSVQIESPSSLREEGRPGTAITIILPIQYTPEEEIPFHLPSTSELAH